MSKLILDADALALAKRKLQSQPIFAGAAGAFLEPGIVELGAEGANAEVRWQPGDQRTTFLALAGEACRDVVHHANAVLAAATAERGRALRSMTVPACTLMDVTRQLLAELNNSEQRAMRSSWPQRDQEAYRDAARRLKKRVAGPVREARNKLGAHLDAAAYSLRVQVSLDDVLAVLGDSLMLLLLALNHDSRSFSWIRFLGQSQDGSRSVVETMFSYPVAARWLTDATGRVLDVGFLQLAADPRIEIQEVALSVSAVYNQLAALDGSSSPTMWLEFHEAEAVAPHEFKIAEQRQ